MKIIRITLKKIIIPVFIITLLFSGCSRSNENQQPKNQQIQSEQQEDKIPEQLKDIENSIEKIIKTLNGPAIETEDKKEPQLQQNANKSKNKQDDTGNKSNGQEKGGEEEGGGEGEDKKAEKDQDNPPESNGQNQEQSDSNQEQSKKPTQTEALMPNEQWNKIEPVINTLHYKWNSYMPMTAKKNADRKLIENFSTALNSLTDSIISKSQTNTLMAASYLYAYIPDFYMLYRTETSPAIKRVRYYTRNAMLNSMTANWTQAESDINNLKSVWSIYKNTVSQEQQENVSKLDYSIYELEKVIMERNQSLSDIKGRVAMSNIQELEK